LEQNYRSTNTILQAANAVISGNTERHSKNLWSANGEGEKLIVAACEDGEDEADFISNYLLQEHDGKRIPFSDFAILYRSNHLSRLIEIALRRSGIPFRLVGGQEFFQRREIKDAVAYLKLLVNPREDQSFLRILSVPPRGLGEKAVNRLKELKAASFLPFSVLLGEDAFLTSLTGKARGEAEALAGCLGKYREVFNEPGGLSMKVRKFLEEAGYLKCFQKLYKNYEEAEKRMENVESFLSSIVEFELKSVEPPSLMDYLESYALLEENDRTEEDDNGDAVTLSTIHAAKGLEYQFVFLPAMERGIFPNERSMIEGGGKCDEEMRLFYVALTRARRRLLLTFSRERVLRGSKVLQRPSAFLEKLPEPITEFYAESDALVRTVTAAEFDQFIAQIKC
ncbi:MAG: ATP-dependent helicase, partial [Victivallaceae bacterium]|nr:ATP-dependent helicase [Victivallaceae bacterium]